MQGLMLALVGVPAVASRPAEARLWRAGRISDHVFALLLLARFPIICFLLGVLLGASLPFVIAIVVVAVATEALFHRVLLETIRQERWSGDHAADLVDYWVSEGTAIPSPTGHATPVP